MDMLDKNSADNIFFFKKIDIDISCKLSSSETTCMKCQFLFSYNNRRQFAQNVNRISSFLVK